MRSRRPTIYSAAVVLMSVVLYSGPLQANPNGFNYGGRITDATGKPVAGPVDLEIKFFDDDTDGTQVGPTKTIPDVALVQGAFQVSIDLTAAERDLVFGTGNPVFLQIKDLDGGRTYPRQSIGAVPYALRVPVDGVTIDYNADGKLEVLDMGGVPQSDVTLDGAGAFDVALQANPAATEGYTLTFPAAAGPSGWVLSTSGATGILSWINPAAGGGGDMLGANNLSEIVDDSVARTNLGVEIGTDVEAHEATLTGLAATTPTANHMLYANGADTFTTVATTAFGRGLLAETNAASLRTTAGAQASEATLTGLAGTAPTANQMLYANGADSFTTVATTAFGRGLLNETNAASLLTTAGAQAGEATLTGLAATAPTANQMLYANGADSFTTMATTAFGRGLLNETNAASLLSTAGGQAADAQLTELGGLSTADGNFIVGSGANWVVESGATARTSMGAQAADATLTGLAGTTIANNDMIYATGVDAFSTISSTVAGRAMITAADASAQRTLLGIGTITDPTDTFTQADTEYVATDEIRARDAGGLKLNDDSGTAGILIEDGGQVGVNKAAPLAWLHAEATAAAASNEEIARFSVSDNATAYLTIGNGNAVNGAYTGSVLGVGHGVNTALGLGAYIVTDTGTAPAMVLDSSIGGTAALVTRPVFEIRNHGAAVMTIEADGKTGIGTNDPSARLDVANGLARFGGSTAMADVQGAYIGWNRSGTLGETNFTTHKGLGAGGFTFDNTADGSAMTRLMTIEDTGDVGIGTLTPATKLQVNGQIAGGFFADTDATIDWQLGNIQSTSVAPGATLSFAVNSMVNGGSYTLALTNTTGGNYTLGTAGDISTWRCIPACAGNVVTTDATKHTVLTILKMGTTGYVSWIKGF